MDNPSSDSLPMAASNLEGIQVVGVARRFREFLSTGLVHGIVIRVVNQFLRRNLIFSHILRLNLDDVQLLS